MFSPEPASATFTIANPDAPLTNGAIEALARLLLSLEEPARPATTESIAA
jgi:hypothetical protein